MKTIGKWKSGSLAALFVVVMTLGMMAGCASSDEQESSDCNCAEGDWNCKDRCTQPGT